MRRPFDPARFRRIVAGVSLLAAPLCGLAWSLLVPPFTAGMAGEVAFIAAHPSRWAVATYLGVACSYLLIPAVLGVMHLFRTRAVVLGHVGGALALAGSAFHGTMLGFQLAEPPIVLTAVDRAQAVALASALTEQPVFLALLLPMTGLFVGLLLLAIALWRARAAPTWVAVLLAGAVVIEIAGPPALKARLFFALLLAGLGRVGVALLRMSDAEWQRAAAPPLPLDGAADGAVAPPAGTMPVHTAR